MAILLVLFREAILLACCESINLKLDLFLAFRLKKGCNGVERERELLECIVRRVFNKLGLSIMS